MVVRDKSHVFGLFSLFSREIRTNSQICSVLHFQTLATCSGRGLCPPTICVGTLGFLAILAVTNRRGKLKHGKGQFICS